MKLNLLITLLCLSYTFAFSQDKLAFNYDTAGNQILRDRICLNCYVAVADAAKDSLPPDISDLTSQDWLKEKFIASPNPVTAILNVEWLSSKENDIRKIALYGGGNQLLFTLNTTNNRNSAEIDFSRFPSGFYLLLVTFADGNTKTHKIIKK
jgi:hypothetical protein